MKERILNTEKRNPDSMNIDKLGTVEMLKVMNNENRKLIEKIEEEIDSIGKAVEAAANSISKGGRIIYVGAGTSGRLGVIDAAECPPTFGVSRDTVVGVIAGGDGALRNASEGIEDMAQQGREDILKLGPCKEDTVVGISAAGGAAYVLECLKAAKESGAVTVGITCNKDTPIANQADISITPDTGAEVVTGSTRLKAGTAQKIILNMISTGAMIKTGKVYENLMINVKPVNQKLEKRCVRIIKELTRCEDEVALRELKAANGSIRAAVEKIKGGI